MSGPGDLERKLRRHRLAPPSAELKTRVLHAAASVPPARVSRIDLLWFSRPARSMAAALFVALLLASVFENRALARRLGPLNGEPTIVERESLDWIERETGMKLGRRAALIRFGRDAETIPLDERLALLELEEEEL